MMLMLTSSADEVPTLIQVSNGLPPLNLQHNIYAYDANAYKILYHLLHLLLSS